MPKYNSDDNIPVALDINDLHDVFPRSKPRNFDIEIKSTALKPVVTDLALNKDIVSLICMKCDTPRDVDLNVGYNLNNVWVGIRFICGCGNVVELKDNQLKLT